RRRQVGPRAERQHRVGPLGDPRRVPVDPPRRLRPAGSRPGLVDEPVEGDHRASLTEPPDPRTGPESARLTRPEAPADAAPPALPNPEGHRADTPTTARNGGGTGRRPGPSAGNLGRVRPLV